MNEKAARKRAIRRQQIANQARRKKLADVPLHDRRRFANVMDQNAALYAAHDQIAKPFDPSPKVIPPK